MSMLAEEGIRALAQGLPRVKLNPNDLEARSDCLYGAWLCGTLLGAVGMALHHKLCHTLGGTWNLPHAETHTAVLPHAAAYNAAAVPDAMNRVARALGVAKAQQGLYDLALNLGAPVALKDIGMPESDLDRAADLATTAPYWNPRPVERAAVRKLLDDAYFGRRPA
jgi:maleylacetate reductase